MSKTVTIPSGDNPFIAKINDKYYSYPAGTTVEVPDEVAALIESIQGNDAPATIPAAPDMPRGGAVNDVLTRTSDGAEWKAPASSSSLPEVSGSDNGKVLKVVEGAWAAASAPSGLPAVTAADENKSLVVKTTYTVGAVIVPEQTAAANDDTEMTNANVSLFTEGATVRAVIDGIVYTGTIVDDGGLGTNMQDEFNLGALAVFYISPEDNKLYCWSEMSSPATVSLNLLNVSSTVWDTAYTMPLVCHEDAQNTLDKTWAEIFKALKSGRPVYIGVESNGAVSLNTILYSAYVDDDWYFLSGRGLYNISNAPGYKTDSPDGYPVYDD